jgi:hypothetical protein
MFNSDRPAAANLGSKNPLAGHDFSLRTNPYEQGAESTTTKCQTTMCWSAKGGSGTTVITASLGLCSLDPVTLIDLAGDLPAVLGIAEPAGPGILEWLQSDAPIERLSDITVPVTEGLSLLPSGRGDRHRPSARWAELLSALTTEEHRVIIDAGTGQPPTIVHNLVDRSLLVTRACYLALRRVVSSPIRPTGVILVNESGRALREVDVEAAVGAPILANVGLDPQIARCVDAGLMAARLPRMMRRDLGAAA